MIQSKLQKGSFRGVPFNFTQSERGGGRKSVIHTFPNSNAVITEDLGRAPQIFKLSIIIKGADGNADDYEARRDAMIAALESEGVGELVHPIYGTVNVQLSGEFTCTENLDGLGRAEFSATFVRIVPANGVLSPIGEIPYFPEASVNVNTIANLRNRVAEKWVEDWVDYAVISPKTLELKEEFLEAAENGFDLAEAIMEGTDKLKEYKQKLEDFKRDLFATPIEIAQAVKEMFDAVNDLVDEARDLYDWSVSFFQFGDMLTDLTRSTLSNIQYNVNIRKQRGIMQTYGLCYAAGAAVNIQFRDEDELREYESVINDQFDKVLRSGDLSDDAYRQLQLQRVATNIVFSEKATTVQKVTTITVRNPVSLASIVHDYYGNLDNYETIRDLNSFDDTAQVSGEIRILAA